jgi:hypothetical protein
MEVLLEVRLADRHRPTGHTRHLKDGQPVAPPVSLRIARDSNSDGVFLLYLDADDEEQTDTWHQSIGDAQDQASLEFGVQQSDWHAPPGSR